jgi:hypothetical protein
VVVDGRLVFLSHVCVHILDAEGQEVHYPGWNIYGKLSSPDREDFVAIGPGYAYGTEFSGQDWQVALPNAGTYRVYATFESWEKGEAFGLRAWVGNIQSNSVAVTIAERPSQR